MVVAFLFVGHRSTRFTHGIQKHVGRLEVSVQHGSGVDVLERPQDMVDEVLHVVLGKMLVGVDDSVQIHLH